MAARALTHLSSGWGAFPKGAPITGVPAGVERAWIAAGVAERVDAPPAPEPLETATAPAPEAAVVRVASGGHPSGEGRTTPVQRRRAGR